MQKQSDSSFFLTKTDDDWWAHRIFNNAIFIYFREHLNYFFLFRKRRVVRWLINRLYIDSVDSVFNKVLLAHYLISHSKDFTFLKNDEFLQLFDSQVRSILFVNVFLTLYHVHYVCQVFFVLNNSQYRLE